MPSTSTICAFAQPYYPQRNLNLNPNLNPNPSLTVAQVAVWGLLSLRASDSIASAALWAVLRAPPRFFDALPLGRILNRFAKVRDTW